MGRLVSIDSPDAGLTRHAYDESGNRIEKNHNSHVTQYSFDVLNRLTATAYGDGSPGISYSYDTGMGDFLKGWLASVTDASGQRHYAYDANGYPDYEQRIIDGVTYTTDYQYDAAGNLRSMVYPTGQIVEYLPQAVDPGRIWAVRLNDNQNLAASMTYRPFGPNTRMTLGNTLTAVRAYDKNHQIRTITAGNVVDYTYTPDAIGRVAVITDNLDPSRTQHFDYDALSRLTGATGTPDYTYTHDGQRVTKTIDPSTTIYHYDTTGRLIAETDAQGNMIKAYIWLQGQPLAQIDAGGEIYYYHNDHLGTPRKMTDGNGSVVWAADYFLFGQADVIVGAVENNLRFAGQYYDQETGLHYNYFRYYDPKLGRYLRADPIGLAGGVNLYAYVDNNPINLIDPDGLDAIYINYDYYPVSTPVGKLPLGHGGVVAVDPNTGVTKYYEFGRL